MTKFASKSTRGFYSTEIFGANMPADVVEISDEYHAELLEGESKGKIIDWSCEPPKLADQPPPTFDELSKSVRIERDRLMREVYDPAAHMLLRLQRTAPAEQQSAIKAKLCELDIYAQSLQDIPEQAGFPINIEWPTVPAKEI